MEKLLADKINIWLICAYLVIIFIVYIITKGTTRIAEIAARFSLDSLPAKQMIIEEKLKTNKINIGDSEKMKQKLQSEINFIGRLDGSGRFILKINKIAIIAQTFVILVFVGLLILDKIKSVTYIKNILIVSIGIQIIVLIVFVLMGYKIIKYINKYK
jgi:flagellar biosynthesis protein FlhA